MPVYYFPAVILVSDFLVQLCVA